MTVFATGMRGDNPVQIPIPGNGQLYGETCGDHLMYWDRRLVVDLHCELFVLTLVHLLTEVNLLS